MATLPLVCSAVVVNGLDIVTVTEPTVLTALNCRPAAAVTLGGDAYFVIERLTPSTFRIERPWPGAGATVACTIGVFTPEMSSGLAISQQLRDYSAKLGLYQARGLGFYYKALGATGAADPGKGNIAYVGTSWADASVLCIDVLDAIGVSRAGLIDRWKMGDIIIIESAETGAYITRQLTETPSNEGPGAWRKIAGAEVIDGDGLLVDGEDLRALWLRAGTAGPGFTYDAVVADIAARAAHDAAAVGFKVFVSDVGGAEAGRAAVDQRFGAPGNWVRVAWYTGPKGGQGDKGWAPQLVTEADGERTVLKLAGYVGGQGTPPTANVGEYLKPDGTFTVTIGAARDVTGKSFNWRTGGYNGATAFAKRDVIRDQGASWIALQDTTGNAPPTYPTTSNAHWELMVAPGANGAGTVASVVGGTGISVNSSDPANPVVSAPTLVTGPASAIADRVAVFDGITGKLLKDGGKTISELVPAGYGDLLVTVSLLALQVADNTNVALFLGSSGNRVADSFDTLTYVDVAGATSLDSSVAGLLKPSIAGTSVQIGAFNANSAVGSGYTFVDRATAILNSVVITKIGVYSNTSRTYTLKIVLRNSAGNYDVVVSQSKVHTGTGWEDLALSSNYSVPASGSYFLAAYTAAATLSLTSNTGNRAFKTGDITGAGQSGFSEDAFGEVFPLRYEHTPLTQNLTVRSASFTATAAPTKMKALLRVKEVDTATAGTDYALECSRNGGTTWSTMTLTELFTSPSPTTGIRVVEAAETDVSGQPSGTTPRWRFKTLNNKMVELHDVFFYWS